MHKLFTMRCKNIFIYLQLFYYTHHLFVVWWTLLILHAPNFWKWFIGPAVIYIIERIFSLSIVNKARYGKTFIKEGIIFPSNVSRIMFSIPVALIKRERKSSQVASHGVSSSHSDNPSENGM